MKKKKRNNDYDNTQSETKKSNLMKVQSSQ